jgi:choline monooxygenase
MNSFFVDPDISLAKTIDKEFYIDAGIFELCKERIFAGSWQFIGDTRMAGSPGDIYPINLLDGFLDEPLVLTRDKANQLHLLSNVCTHRGNLLVEKACSASHLRCRYHGRLFQLDGKFHSMPEFKEVKQFPSPEDDLKTLPLFSWGPLLFSSLNQTRPADLFLADMIHRVGWIPLEDFVFRPELSRDLTVHAHWALYCENYLEGFHIPFVHAGLNTIIDFGNYRTELFELSSLQLGIARDDEDCFNLPAGSPDYGQKIAAYYFFVFPNMMFNFYPWGLSVNLVKPVSLRETRVSFHSYVWNEKKYNSGAGSNLDQVEEEDEEVVENVQRGIRSRYYRQGRYSVTREQGTHHFHQIISSFLQ